jgi:hypothetical protein
MANPSMVVNISDVFHTKCELMRFYMSQINSFPYVEYINALNTWRGILHHRQGQAEAFHILSL